MRRTAAICLIALGCLSPASADDPTGSSLLFDEPAERFTESCVLGSGRLGAMDQQLLRYLFDAVIQSSELLGERPDGRSPCEIELLPALPTDWPDGEVRGLQASGGVEVSLCWADGRLRAAKLVGRWAPEARVRYADATREVALPAGEAVELGFE